MKILVNFSSPAEREHFTSNHSTDCIETLGQTIVVIHDVVMFQASNDAVRLTLSGNSVLELSIQATTAIRDGDSLELIY